MKLRKLILLCFLSFFLWPILGKTNAVASEECYYIQKYVDFGTSIYIDADSSMPCHKVTITPNKYVTSQIKYKITKTKISNYIGWCRRAVQVRIWKTDQDHGIWNMWQDVHLDLFTGYEDIPIDGTGRPQDVRPYGCVELPDIEANLGEQDTCSAP